MHVQTYHKYQIYITVKLELCEDPNSPECRLDWLPFYNRKRQICTIQTLNKTYTNDVVSMISCLFPLWVSSLNLPMAVKGKLADFRFSFCWNGSTGVDRGSLVSYLEIKFSVIAVTEIRISYMPSLKSRLWVPRPESK